MQEVKHDITKQDYYGDGDFSSDEYDFAGCERYRMVLIQKQRQKRENDSDFVYDMPYHDHGFKMCWQSISILVDISIYRDVAIPAYNGFEVLTLTVYFGTEWIQQIF